MKIPTLDKKAYNVGVSFVIDIACIFCLARMLTFLCYMGNEVYQSLKNIQAAHAFLYLAIFMCITQRIRLINWQSLVVSLLYLPIGYMYQARSYPDSPDLYNRDRLAVLIVWIVLLIIVDMAVHKKVNPLQKLNPVALSIYAAMTIFMIFYRNSRTYPIVLVLAFLFYLIPLDEEGWNKIIKQFCLAWILAFFFMLYRSIKYNPEVSPNGRWYGDFLNIGDFGLFTACAVTVVLYKIYQNKKLLGRKSLSYILYCFCLLPIIWTIFRVSTITMFIGIGCIFLMGFILLQKNISPKAILFRLTTVLLGIPIIVLLLLLILKTLTNTDVNYWYTILSNGNALLKPIANLIVRAHYMFGQAKTFADSNIFDPNSLINYLDLFSSGRLSICTLFAERFNATGNPSAGIQVGNYFATNAHNGYVQIIYEYGYMGGGLYILWLLYSTGASMVQYIKEKSLVKVLPCLWLAMALGVQLGEAPNLYSPLLIMTLIITYPIMVKFDKVKETALQ